MFLQRLSLRAISHLLFRTWNSSLKMGRIWLKPKTHGLWDPCGGVYELKYWVRVLKLLILPNVDWKIDAFWWIRVVKSLVTSIFLNSTALRQAKVNRNKHFLINGVTRFLLMHTPSTAPTSCPNLMYSMSDAAMAGFWMPLRVPEPYVG